MALTTPNGVPLVNLLVSPGASAELRREARELPAWHLTPAQMCDLELLMNGGFSPLTGFMGRANHHRVCQEMRLADGTLWPLPVTLRVPEILARTLAPGASLALRDRDASPLAVLRISDVWEADCEAEAKAVFGTMSRDHPGVAYLLGEEGEWCVGGRVEGIVSPEHFDFQDLRFGPAALRAEFARRGWERVVAFQTRNPIHRAHFELTVQATKKANARLLLHPVVGVTRPGDVDAYTRVRCYRAVMSRYPAGSALLALLPLSMRMAGPREALQHAIVRRNYGATHFIVGRDHAGPGVDAAGKPFYGPYDAHAAVQQFRDELGIEILPFRDFLYLPEAKAYVPEDEVPAGAKTLALSGTELRRRLATGEAVPEWFSFPEVWAELTRGPLKLAGGRVLFFTGLPAAGKSTLVRAVAARLMEDGVAPVTILDGDEVRRRHWPELGFSRADRDENIRRIGRLAAETAEKGGVVLCAAIAPYDAVRREVRATVERVARFSLVYVATSLEVCEARDPKGLYAKARQGLLPQFTGVSDPYEVPIDADISVGFGDEGPGETARKVARLLG